MSLKVTEFEMNNSFQTARISTRSERSHVFLNAGVVSNARELKKSVTGITSDENKVDRSKNDT